METLIEDRRIKKTKRAFYNALLKLLEKEEIRNIRIQELCDLADSHRSTFYYHYSDIYALYDELEEKVLDDYSALWVTDEEHSYYSVYENIINYLYDNRDVWSVLVGANGSKNFKKHVSELLEKKYLEVWELETGRDTFSDEFHIIAKSNISAYMTLFTEWLAEPESFSLEEIESMLGTMDNAFDALLEQYL